MNLGGQDSKKLADYLFDSYNETVDKVKETRRFVQGWRASRDDVFFVELKFRVKPGSASGHANTISDLINQFFSKIPADEDEIYFKPRCHAIDDSTIGIGQKLHF